MEPRLSLSIWTRSGLPGREFFLADEFIERPRTHALGQGWLAAGTSGSGPVAAI